MGLAGFVRKIKLLPGFLALATLGVFSFQSVALPSHEIQHSVQQAKSKNSSLPQLNENGCELCLTFQTQSAATAFVPVIGLIRFKRPLLEVSKVFEIPAFFRSPIHARAPPFFALT